MKLTAHGFTLVELLVVISIMSLMAIVSFAKYATLKQEQYLKGAANELQSLIRTAQTNATSGVKCTSSENDPSGTWVIEFKVDKKNIDLKCFVSDPTASLLKKTLTFESNQPSIESITGKTGFTQCSSSFPDSQIRVSFAPLTGAITFTDTNPAASSCLDTSSEISISIKKDTGSPKFVTLGKGGFVEIR